LPADSGRDLASQLCHSWKNPNMNRRTYIPCQLDALRPLASVAIVLLLLEPLANAAEQPVEPIALTISGTSVTLNFVVCPKGTMIDLKPGEAPKPPKELTRPLRILQTEVSYEDFCAVYGHDRADAVLDTNIANTETKEPIVLLKKEARQAAYPMYGLTIEEAFAFCDILKGADPESKVEYSKIAHVTYRLPTHLEWQYACRAADTVDEAEHRKRDFPRWMTLPDDPGLTKWLGLTASDLSNPESVVDRFLARDETGPWGVSEERIWSDAGRLPAADYDMKRFHDAFRVIANQGLYGQSVMADSMDGVRFGMLPCGVMAAPTIKTSDKRTSTINELYCKNDWGIYHMLDNVSELTLDDDDIKAHAHYFIDGFGSIQHDTSKQDRNRVFVWGGQKYNLHGEEESLAVKRKRKCGFRVVRVRELMDSWFLAIRETAWKDDALADLESKLQKQGQTVADLSNREPFTSDVEQIVSFYKNVVRFRAGKVDGNDPGISPVELNEAELEKDPYFSLLAKLTTHSGPKDPE